MTITKEQLISIMPKASSTASVYLPLINKFASEFNVNTKARMAYLLATIAVESAEMTATTENLNYSAERLLAVFPKYFNASSASKYGRNPVRIGNRVYANRMGNGNEASGDGYKFRGRGMIQLTGKTMYALYSKYCGVDLLTQPELLSHPFGAMRSAFWYFCVYAQLLDDCDRGDTKSIRKKVNGGYNGYDAFVKYANKALRII